MKVEYYHPVQQGKCGRPHEERQEGSGSKDPGPLGGTKTTKSEEEEEYTDTGDDIIRIAPDF